MIAFTYTTRKLNHAGRNDEALQCGRRGIEWGEAIVRAHPRDIDLRVGLSDLVLNMTDLYMPGGHRSTDALAYAQKGVTLIEDVSRENPLLFRPRQVLVSALNLVSMTQCDLGQLVEARRSAERAAEYAEAYLKHTPEFIDAQLMLGGSLLSLGKVHVSSGTAAEALPIFRRAAELDERSGECACLFNAACCLALASSIDDSAGPESPADRQARRSRDADRAVALVKKAIAHGLSNLEPLKGDPDLEPIRARPDFQLLIQDLAFPVDPFAL
jgi:hypothetical protein